MADMLSLPVARIRIRGRKGMRAVTAHLLL